MIGLFSTFFHFFWAPIYTAIDDENMPFQSKMLLKHGAHAGLYSAAAVVLGGFRFTQNLRLRDSLGGVRMPLPVAFAALGLANSVMSDVVHNFVMPHIPADAKWEDEIALGVGVGYSAMMAPAWVYLVSPRLFKQAGALNLAFSAGAAELVATLAQSFI